MFLVSSDLLFCHAGLEDLFETMECSGFWIRYQLSDDTVKYIYVEFLNRGP